jgi:hypothetical protein
MKTKLLFCFIPLLAPGLRVAGAMGRLTGRAKAPFISYTNKPSLTYSATASPPVIKLLRLKLKIDSFNYDDIAIGFMANAS